MQALAVTDAWFNWRNRLLASAGFRRLACRLAPTRWIARRRAAALFDLVAGFVYSQVLLACVRLKLFDILAEGPQCLAELARRVALDEVATDRLLAAAVSLKLVQRRGSQRFGLGPLGATMVGNGAVAAMVEHHVALYADLADPVALLRGQGASGQLAAYWPYSSDRGGATAERVAAYTELMATSQSLVAEEVLDCYSFSGHRSLLDIGGGDGSFLLRVAQRAPHLQLLLFDLPAVVERAQARIRQTPAAHRISTIGGSFLSDQLPQGADVATLLRVVHDHDDAAALKLLIATREALLPGATLLVAEPMSRTSGALAMGDAYFGFYLLAMGTGRPRSLGELGSLLLAAGFESIKHLPTQMPLQISVISARTPGSGSA